MIGTAGDIPGSYEATPVPDAAAPDAPDCINGAIELSVYGVPDLERVQC